MSAEADMPEVPATELGLNLRGLRSYVARDDEALVIVLEESSPTNDGVAITLEPGIWSTSQDAIDGAVALARTATHYAELLRTRAGLSKPLRPA